ncbi:MAG: right-handed parallel beta-helix repeat-containing protein [Verrucomicrobia bacterium]|nr:right-handed parallel beta-helix repeat-containing protein [Verrucomicrobiota bacterium]MCH8526958.1 right-handed parallel beta-helix repeat-containing protein [Kiritimatiellia bacterium]
MPIPRRRLISAVLLACALSATAEEWVLHVAPEGSDGAQGSLEAPFQTLERARDVLRERRRENPDAFDGASVILHPGRYFRGDAFTLNAADGGRPDAPVVYRAKEPGTVVLDGGRVLAPAAFRAVEDPSVLARLLPAVRGRVKEVDLRGEGIRDFGDYGPRGWGRDPLPAPAELFVDGVPQRVARWPNEGSVPLGEILEEGSRPRDGDTDNRSAVFKYNTGRAGRWTEAEDLFISGIFGVSWAHDIIRIAEIDTEKETFTTEGAHMYGFRQPGFLQVETHYHAVNLLEEIEEPGEYYINRGTGVLYFLPVYPLDHSLIQLSLLADPFMRLDEVSHLIVEGLIFENARGAGVEVLGGQRVQIRGCTLRMLGGTAIHLNGGEGHVVRSCDIYHTGVGGVIAEGGDRQTLEPAAHEIRNTDIHCFNRWMAFYNPAIRFGGVGHTAANNHLHHGLHQGVTFSGNEHRIAYNEFNHLLLDISDMGAVYAGRNPTFAGNVIHGNFFHHLDSAHRGGPGVQAVFLDDGTMYATRITNNVFYKAGSSSVIKFNYGGGSPVANNISVRGPRNFIDGGSTERMKQTVGRINNRRHPHNLYQRYREVPVDREPYLGRYPYLHDMMRDGAALETPTWNNFVTQNELEHFMDPANLDFTVRPDSPLLKRVAEDVTDAVTGLENAAVPFEAIAFDRIGLHPDEHRAPGPLPFEKLGPTDGAAVEPGGETPLWWRPSHNANAYRVRIASDASMRDIAHEAFVRGKTHAAIPALEAGTYYWQVTAVIDRSRSNRGERAADTPVRSFVVQP